ncbi:MAG: F0F1 ATP synthase subunit A [Acidobacteria bacterium]|nr:F0F1 ATP synthase subunit A [Acidobacteriota bacterium]
MQEHEFFVSVVLNRYIFNPTAHALGLHYSGHESVPAHITMLAVICLALILLAVYLRRRLSVENPGNLQQAFELLYEGLSGFMRDIIGSSAHRFFPLVAGLFLFIWTSNLLGLVPGFMSPTSNINVTAGLGIIVFLYYNAQGFREHGFLKYMAHFAGPSLVIAPLLFLIEIISHMARPFSLSVRLFGNIFAEELIIGTLNDLFPFVISMPVMALALFAGTIQAFIFVVLTMVYLGGAVEHSHAEEVHHGPSGENVDSSELHAPR